MKIKKILGVATAFVALNSYVAAEMNPILTLGETELPEKGYLISSADGFRPFGEGVFFIAGVEEDSLSYPVVWKDGILSLLYDPDQVSVSARPTRFSGEWAIGYSNTYSPNNGTLHAVSSEGDVFSVEAMDLMADLGFSLQGSGFANIAIDGQGRIAVTALDNIHPHFLLSIVDGQVELIAQESVTPVPGEEGEFFSRFFILGFSPDGEQLLFGGPSTGSSSENGIYLWHRQTGEIELVVKPHLSNWPGTDDPITALAPAAERYYFFTSDGSIGFYAYSTVDGEALHRGLLAFVDGELVEIMSGFVTTADDEALSVNFSASGPEHPPTSFTTMLTPENDLIVIDMNRIHLYDTDSNELHVLARTQSPYFGQLTVYSVDETYVYLEASQRAPEFPLLFLDYRIFRIPLAGGEPEQIYSAAANGARVVDVFEERVLFRSTDEQSYYIGTWDNALTAPELNLFSRFTGIESSGMTDWGQMDTTHFPYVYHDEKGWLYISGQNLNSFFFYDIEEETWSWTQWAVAPWYFTFGNPGSWHHFE